jgi:hypothetical protein
MEEHLQIDWKNKIKLPFFYCVDDILNKHLQSNIRYLRW